MMGRQAVGGVGQSLGELIAALRPGDACPWCGARLQSGPAVRRTWGAEASSTATGSLLDTSEVVVCCLKCGCEVFAAEESRCMSSRKPLGAAA